MLSADMLRLGLITAGALVLIVSFAASVQFLAEGRIDLAGALMVMGLAAVPMLQYTLPFACGFGSTLAYHRFAADNEATAAAAAGVSHRSLAVPALALGLACAGGLTLLTNTAIPRFLREMEVVVRSDLAGVLVRDIERGRPIRLDRFEIAAREAVSAGPDPAVGAVDRLQLTDALAAQLDRDGSVAGYVYARVINVWLFEEETPEGRYTAAQLQFVDVDGDMDGERLGSRRFESARVRIPSGFSDDPKFLTFSELRALRTRPENLNVVDAHRRTLASRLEERELIEALRTRLAVDGRVVLERPGPERVIVTAGALEPDDGRWRLVPLEGLRAVRVERQPARTSSYFQQATEAWIRIESQTVADARGGGPTLALELEGVTTIDERGASAGSARSRGAITGLSRAGSEPGALSGLGVNELVGRADEAVAQGDAALGEEVERAKRRLVTRVASLQREVTGKQHERVAYAVASLVAVLCGCVVALRRQGGLALPVYLWSFFPALGSVITINAGERLTHQIGAPGLLLLWGGVAALAVYTFVEYRRLCRH